MNVSTVAILLMMFATLAMACSSANEPVLPAQEPTNEPVLPAQEPTNEPVLPAQEPTNEPVLPIYEPTAPVGFAAGLSGKLIVEGHCLYLGNDEFGVRWFPVFKAGTISWEKDTLILHGERYKIGDIVPAGGGEITDLNNLRLLQEPDESCDVRNAWMVNGRQ